MANFFVWLLAAVGPLAKKVLLALGIGAITYTGVDALTTTLINQMAVYFGQTPADIAGFLALAGMFEGVGIMLGGIVARASLAAVSRLGLLL